MGTVLAFAALAGCGGYHPLTGTGVEAVVQLGNGVTSARVQAESIDTRQVIDLGPCLAQSQCLVGKRVASGRYRVTAESKDGSRSDWALVTVVPGQIARVGLNLRW